jgi:hypothetical protein
MSALKIIVHKVLKEILLSCGTRIFITDVTKDLPLPLPCAS